MEIKLLPEGHEDLKKVSVAWDFVTDGDPKELITKMTKLMFENNGIGLAAPQCGVLKRLFIMGTDQKLYAIINPEIISGEGSERDLEGCLSFPNLWMRVNRLHKIKVRYHDITGQTIETEFTGLIARVFQHENDHLDGICFDSRVGPATLDLAKEKRRRKSG